jgi:hypothetical protein
MIFVWERRVLAAVLGERDTPLWERARAARLAATGPLRRFVLRATVALAATTFALLTFAVLAFELIVGSI